MVVLRVPLNSGELVVALVMAGWGAGSFFFGQLSDRANAGWAVGGVLTLIVVVMISAFAFLDSIRLKLLLRMGKLTNNLLDIVLWLWVLGALGVLAWLSRAHPG